MELPEFSEAIREMRQRIATFQPGPDIAPSGAPHPFVRDLETVCEELNVAEEELRTQNEELDRTRRVAEEQRQRYRELFDFAPDGYLVTDPDGVIREANLAAAQLFGFDARLLVGRPLVDYVAPQEQRVFHAELSRLLLEERPQEWTTVLRPRVKPPVPVSIRVAVARDLTGEAREVRWSVRDVSERWQAIKTARDTEESLREQWRKREAELVAENLDLKVRLSASELNDALPNPYQVLFEENPQPMWVFDALGRVPLAVNAAALRLYGYGRDEFLRLHLGDLCRAVDRQGFFADLGGPGGTWRHHTRDGREVAVRGEVSAFPLAGHPAARLVRLTEAAVEHHAAGPDGEAARLLAEVRNRCELIVDILPPNPLVEAQLREVLRLAGQAQARVARAAEGGPAAAPEPCTVLLVEEQPVLRSLIASTLRGAGYQVLEAGDAREAMAVEGRHPGPIQLLVCTVELSKMGGDALAAAFRRRRPGLKVLLTSSAEDDDPRVQNLMRAGCDFLPKPFRLAELLARARDILPPDA